MMYDIKWVALIHQPGTNWYMDQHVVNQHKPNI